jgi:hypothetical protein
VRVCDSVLKSPFRHSSDPVVFSPFAGFHRRTQSGVSLAPLNECIIFPITLAACLLLFGDRRRGVERSFYDALKSLISPRLSSCDGHINI